MTGQHDLPPLGSSGQHSIIPSEFTPQHKTDILLGAIGDRLSLVAHAQICTSAAMEHRAMAAASNIAGANGQKQHVCMICQEMWPCKTYAHAMRWLIEQVADLPLKESGAHTHKGGPGAQDASKRLDEVENGD